MYILDYMNWRSVLQKAVKRDRRSMNAIAKAAGVPYPRVFLLMQGGGITLDNAERIGRAVGLELVPRSSRRRRSR